MGKFNINKDESFTTNNGILKKRVYTYTRKDKKDITFKETEDIYKTILESGVKPEDIYIQVMANKFMTLKSRGSDKFKDWDTEEYYENRVQDIGRFLNHFEFVRICIMESKGSSSKRRRRITMDEDE